MRITLCGCLSFFDDMRMIKNSLVNGGHVVALPVFVNGTNYEKKDPLVGARNIREGDLIRRHYREIINSNAILVVNKTRKDVLNYIGGNTFLEMGFAYINEKSIFVLNPLPEKVNYYEEMLAMQPTILNGDFRGITC